MSRTRLEEWFDAADTEPCIYPRHSSSPHHHDHNGANHPPESCCIQNNDRFLAPIYRSDEKVAPELRDAKCILCRTQAPLFLQPRAVIADWFKNLSDEQRTAIYEARLDEREAKR